ncbi:hypothetical protein FF38_09287 [Lucilia cuprina]|uniref:MADF domain-containing protein n=1 Tax=Lucilia cuprina TaxID=7375 RepID=A0A0L0CF92_LUCCU|nr:hypothetical protein FF38_09287 [Lucilia cuprina]
MEDSTPENFGQEPNNNTITAPEVVFISDSASSFSCNSNINNSGHDSSNNNTSNLKNADRSKYLLLKYIELLKEETAIWKTDTEQYKDPNERDKSWKSLFAKYIKFDKNTRMQKIKKKYAEIVNAYKSEIEKMRTNDNLVPTLWYFEHINFLRNYLNDLLEEEGQDVSIVKYFDIHIHKRDRKKSILESCSS